MTGIGTRRAAERALWGLLLGLFCAGCTAATKDAPAESSEALAGSEAGVAEGRDVWPDGVAGTETPDVVGLGAGDPGLRAPEASAFPATGVRVIGESVEGRDIVAHVVGGGEEVAFLFATIHGDEAAGTPLLEALIETLERDPAATAGRTVVVLPVANPDGFARDTRTNARGVDLNRNFPAANRRDGRRTGTALSEPETRALVGLIEEFRPVVVVSVHGWIGQVDWDGPAAGLATAMGAQCALPAEQLGARPGSFGSYEGVEGGVPTITLELPSSARRADRDALWERYGASLLTAIAWPDPVVAGRS